MTQWFPERLHRHVSTHYEMGEVLYQGHTGFQDLVIFANPTFGRIMALDGVIQTTEADEFVYHEMMAHVPLFAHGAPKRVLIIGGGDGGVLREVLKHPVESVTEVELDAGVVEVSKQYLPSICGNAYDDPRTRLVIGDGAKFLAETQETFDAILVDSTDPIGPGTVLFSREFYANCKRCLTERGILVTQNGVPFMQSDELTTSVGHFRALFPDAWCYLATVPTYVNGAMALGWASLDPQARTVDLDTLRRRYEAAGIRTRYYNPEVHRAAFALPNYVRELIGA
ncbi:MAG TPA: polyamine aminopropyltransferase [Vicinamibacterales bacterium]|nr:polyamine aminopropyltransferase [Vicinamibacterales bacterium]